MKRRTTDPGLLHEFELPLDIPVQAHEEQPPPLTRLRFIATPDPDDAMPVCDRDLLLRSWIKTLARIGAPDMGAERAAQPLRIFRSEQEVVVGFEFRMGICGASCGAGPAGSDRNLHRQ